MRKEILEISRQEKLSHIGSNLGMAEVLEEIYKIKKPEDIVILDAGHAHLAHLIAEKKFNNKEFNLPLHDIHCNYDDGCEVATGSLGLGITIALGRALGNPDRDVYCILSDGGCAEGTVWESLRIKKEQNLNNLKIYVNMNGYSALGRIDQRYLVERLIAFDRSIQIRKTNSDFDNIRGVHAHYKTL